MDVDSQPMPPSEDEFRGASSETHINQADTVGVVDAHVIPGNLSPAQPVITSQLSDSDSSGTLLNSSHSPDNNNNNNNNNNMYRTRSGHETNSGSN